MMEARAQSSRAPEPQSPRAPFSQGPRVSGVQDPRAVKSKHHALTAQGAGKVGDVGEISGYHALAL